MIWKVRSILIFYLLDAPSDFWLVLSVRELSFFLDTIEEEEGEGIILQHYPWEGSDRDYEYEEVMLLHCLSNIKTFPLWFFILHS